MFSFTFYAIFMSFYDVQLKQLYTANFLYDFNPLKMAVQFKFSQLDSPNVFPQFQQAPGPVVRKIGKSLHSDLSSEVRDSKINFGWSFQPLSYFVFTSEGSRRTVHMCRLV